MCRRGSPTHAYTVSGEAGRNLPLCRPTESDPPGRHRSPLGWQLKVVPALASALERVLVRVLGQVLAKARLRPILRWEQVLVRVLGRVLAKARLRPILRPWP
jgi:hypothetical protein